jgi:hypothetical protein
MDLFEFYRTLLFLIMSVYAAVMTVVMVLQAWWLLTGTDRAVALVRKYVVVLLLRMKVSVFRNELLQIAALTALFIYLVYLHDWSHFAGIPIPWAGPATKAAG